MQLVGERLQRAFGQRRVVDDVTVSLAPGEVVGFLGRNGAGKSTTFQMIAGYVAPHAGRILLDGVDVANEPPYARARLGLTYLPQERSVFLKLTARQNILVPLEERGVPRRQRVARADTLLEEFGLAGSRNLPAWALSGGEARKLEVARALALDPEYILLDEPFAGLDPLHVAELQQVIGRLRSRRIGVLLSDHNVLYAFEVIDRGYIINAGRVLVEGPPLALAHDERARRAFLGEEFRLPPAFAGRGPGTDP
jgi:lipopolysaccharide export system ATP-binding protein